MIPGAASIIELAAEFNLLRVAVPVSGLEPRDKTVSERGTVPFRSADCAELGQSPTVLSAGS